MPLVAKGRALRFFIAINEMYLHAASYIFLVYHAFLSRHGVVYRLAGNLRTYPIYAR